MQNIETSVLHVDNNSFTSPLIIETFEKRALAPKHWDSYYPRKTVGRNQ